MNNIISIQDICFNYPKKELFNNFSIEIKEGGFLSILGLNGSGKTTLIKIVLGLIKTEGKIIINGAELNHKNIRNIISKIGVVFENPDNHFVSETVRANIAFKLENLFEKRLVIFDKIQDISKQLGITDLLERDPHSLSGGEKQLVALASALVIEPKVLILDEAFSMMDAETKDRVYELLIRLNREKNVTIINVIQDIEDSLYGTEIVLLDKGELILYEDLENAWKKEKEFTKAGLNLPFVVELSIKLKYYNLVDKIIYNIDEMVGALWK